MSICTRSAEGATLYQQAPTRLGALHFSTLYVCCVCVYTSYVWVCILKALRGHPIKTGTNRARRSSFLSPVCMLCMCMCVYIYTNKLTNIGMGVKTRCSCIYIYIYIYIHIHTHTHTPYTYTHVHTGTLCGSLRLTVWIMYVYIHIHTHMHSPTLLRAKPRCGWLSESGGLEG
jgi:hypothetical protein